jgi:Tfp pilus assembly protein PilF/predicted aspartyl protease
MKRKDIVVALLLSFISIRGVSAQSKQCAIDRTPPSAADQALAARKFEEAARQYAETAAANPTGWPMLGQVRAIMGQGHVPEALALAQKNITSHPDDPLVQTAMGEVRYRRGEINEAALAFNKAMQLNPCLGEVHYDVGRYLEFSGMHRKAESQFDVAHTLSPNSAAITRRWQAAHAIPLTIDQRRAIVTHRLERTTLSDDEKEGLTAALKGLDSREKGSCELASPLGPVKLPIVPIQENASMDQRAMQADGLDISFNGKKRRLEIDTGASGLLLSRAVAKAAGLVPEVNVKVGGVGDEGLTGGYVTHVDDIRIGSMEFKNCSVQVLERNLDGVDGLIGTDVFRDYLVTVDTPGRELRLDLLPRRPGDAEQAVSLDTSDNDQPKSEADTAQDQYVAPEMQEWTRIFRSGHYLIVPTEIGNTPTKLFLLDTGANTSMISPAVAREVSHVSGDSMTEVHGISGKVNKVMEADSIPITFAHVKQITNGMLAYDGSFERTGAGVEISGLIGFPMLRELVLSIDYRDNLIHVVYDPKKGFHIN